MIEFKKRVLDNGLRVIVHEDKSSPLAAFNLLYDVGARDENPNKTGFAHLFEHLMFGGSKHVNDYDTPLQKAGGESNAFTSNDVTNYYEILPAANIETAFWLESDRMLSLSFDPKVLRVQKDVVCEEFKERYLNQPYGDTWLNLRPLAYEHHPYKWATIGKSLDHIENATMDDVKDFFYKHYRPNNAILCVAGNVKADHMFKLAEKWFGPIPSGKKIIREIEKEPKQTSARYLKLERNVPYDNIIKAFHMCSRKDKSYYATDVVTDVLSLGQSSRFNQKLIKEKKLFISLDAYITGNIDPGLLVIDGKPMEGVSIKVAEEAILEELALIKESVSDYELQKVKNKLESQHRFGLMEIMNKAMELCFFELIDDIEGVNSNMDYYHQLQVADIQTCAKNILTETNCSTLHYLKKS